jgi:signal transduction histidine kinase
VLGALVALWSDGDLPPLAAVVGVVLVCGAAGYRLSTPYLILIASPFVITAMWPPNGDDADAASFVLLVLVTAALGFGAVLRSRQHVVAERDASVAAHAETQRERALLEQRSRIARELHDVVAHHISSIAIQAERARYTTAGLPELGADRFAAIGDSARTALDEMRRLLGVMRDPHRPADLAPQPGLDQVPDLIDETRALGATVHYTMRGRTIPLADDIGVVAYRVIQEALTNAGRHAPGAPIEATLDYTPPGLRITVRDHGAVAARSVDAVGYGLIGMRERVASVGGTLTTGDHPGGGFAVVAELPAAVPEAAS